jgi:glycosyltransferase involved in cell wall biosynthesis
VVAARRSSIPEAVGDGALLLEPTDAFEVASEIGQLLADERATASLRARGRARAEELTWARTAAGVAEGVRRAARTGH